MDFIKEKIRVMTEKLKELYVLQQENVEYTYIECLQYKTTNLPPALSENWKPYEPNILFGGVDTHYWLHLQVKAAAPQEHKELRLCVKT
ncbi:MAG: hypothetical protein J6C37_09485, partial [Roseburia sp.]|nr:hypothetical protein [Roseburia sp.]